MMATEKEPESRYTLFSPHQHEEQRRQQQQQQLQYDDNDDDGSRPYESDGSFSSSASSFPTQYWNKARISCRALLLSPRFQNAILFLIVLNSITTGIATFDFVTDNPRILRIFDTIDTAFLFLFSLELWLQFFSCGGLAIFQDSNTGWIFFLDYVIVFTSWAFVPALSILRSFRILKALRLVIKHPELQELFLTLLNVIPRVSVVGLLLLLLFYVYAVILTCLFHDLYQEEGEEQQDSDNYSMHTTTDATIEYDSFGRLDRTVFTLFQIMTLDSWSDLTKDLMETHSWAWLPIVSFILLSTFVGVHFVSLTLVKPKQGTRQPTTNQNTNNQGGEGQGRTARSSTHPREQKR